LAEHTTKVEAWEASGSIGAPPKQGKLSVALSSIEKELRGVMLHNFITWEDDSTPSWEVEETVVLEEETVVLEEDVVETLEGEPVVVEVVESMDVDDDMEG
jgi:hypothetical protein